MGYTLGDSPDVERYSRVERRRETTEKEHVDTELDMQVVDAASAIVTDAETQTCNDFIDESKRLKEELALFKQTNQDLCSSVVDLTAANDRMSLSADFLRNNPEKLKFYTGNDDDFRRLLYLR